MNTINHTPSRTATSLCRVLAHSRILLSALAITCAASFATPVVAQDLVVTRAHESGPIVINGATIHTITGDVIPNGTLVMEDGVIIAVLPEGQAIGFATEPRTIEAAGLHVYPGLISPDTRLGLTEIGAVRATHDYAETVAISPEVVAATAVNPDSTLLPVTRSNGVLTAAVLPGDSVSIFGNNPQGLIPGTASVIRLDGWTTQDLTIEARAGLVVNVPVLRTREGSWMNRTGGDQQAAIDRATRMIDDFFAQAATYAASEKHETVDLRFEAARIVLPTAGHQKPVFFRATDHDQIVWALHTAERHGLRAVIVGGRDAYLSADLIKKLDAAVILDTSLTMPKRDDSPIDINFTAPARLLKEGVLFCLATGDRDANERNLPFSAALAVAYGLKPDAALRAVTFDAAQILGIENLGAIENGFAATLLITDGNPLQAATKIHHAFIDGREIDLSNKQTELRDKYREKYRQLDLINDDNEGDGQ